MFGFNDKDVMQRQDQKVYLIYDKVAHNNLFIFMDKSDELMKRQLKSHYNSLPKDILAISDDIQIYHICTLNDSLEVEKGKGFVCNLTDLKPDEKNV